MRFVPALGVAGVEGVPLPVLLPVSLVLPPLLLLLLLALLSPPTLPLLLLLLLLLLLPLALPLLPLPLFPLPPTLPPHTTLFARSLFPKQTRRAAISLSRQRLHSTSKKSRSVVAMPFSGCNEV